MLSAYAPRIQSASNTVALPIEVYPPDGQSSHTETVTLNVGDASNVDSLYVQAHQPFYIMGGYDRGVDEGFDPETAAAIRINDGPWVQVRDNNVDCAWPEKKLDCVAGHYSTLRFTIPADDAVNGENTIQFRFNGTEGLRSGYRVLGLGFMTPGSPTVQNFEPNKHGAHDGTTFTHEEYSSWAPPSGYDNASDVEAGRQLWHEQGLLQEINGESIQASCSSCHARDGRDLKYFNYSNRTITSRSRGHGLSEKQGKQIAAYIRSIDLKKQDGSTYEAPGTPWDPPYQPGPELMGTGKHPDYSDQVYWAAGAGLKWVFDHDADMMPYLFPKNGDPNQGVDRIEGGKLNWHRIHMDSTLNARAIPISLQFPDWNRWLPRIHPMDAFPNKYNSSYKDEYENDLRDALEAVKNNRSRSTLKNVAREIKQMHIQFRESGLQHAGKPSGYSDNKHALARLSSYQHRLVKTWESMHGYHLEDAADDMYCDDDMAPFCEPRSWMGRERTAFDLAPHISNVNTLRNAPFTHASEDQDNFQSHVWYQVQLVLNPGASPESGGQSPMDWGYQRAFLQSSPVGIGMRVLLSEIKSWQLASNGYGVDGTGGNGYDKIPHDRGWNPFRTEWRLIAQAADSRGLWGNLDRRDRRDAVEAMLQAQWDYQSQFSVSEFPRDDDNRRYNPEGFVPDMNGFTGDKDFAQRMYQTLPKFSDLGVSSRLLSQVASWAQKMWPNTNNPAFTDLVESSPPTARIAAPSDGATLTAPASFAIEVDANDPDGYVEKVDLLVDGEVVSSRTSGDRTFTWTNVSAGTYTLQTRVVDDGEKTAESDPITITVEPGGDIGEPSSQTITLEPGWNLISSRVVPEEEDLDELFKDIRSEITMAKDGKGRTYVPSMDINDIGYWNPFEGLMVHVQSRQTLELKGRSLQPGWTPLELEKGWHILPYLKDRPQPVEEAFDSIKDQLVLVKDLYGRAYIPEYGINEIGELQPGQAYKAFVFEDATLTYPEASTTQQQAEASSSAQSGNTAPAATSEEQQNPFSTFFLARGNGLNEGDRISAWTSDGEKVAEEPVRNGFALLKVYGDASTTDDADGVESETPLTLKLHRADSDTEVPIAASSMYNELTGSAASDESEDKKDEVKFQPDGFYVIEMAKQEGKLSLAQNFPNPFKTTTTFEYALSEEMPVELAVYNVLGQEVAVLVDEPKKPGRHVVTFDASSLSSGVYFYRLRAGGTTETQKMTVVR